MYVIVEGADGTGKTSIARRISDVLELPYHHFSAPGTNPEQEYLDFIETNQSAVLDRSWLGEIVYGPKWRGTDPTRMWKNVEAALRDNLRRTLYILIHSDAPFKSDNSPDILAQHTEIDAAFFQALKQVTVGQKVAFNIANFKGLDHELMILARFARSWKKKESCYPAFVDDYSLTLFNPKFRFVDGHMDVPKTCTCPYFRSHMQYDYYRDWGEITWGTGSLAPRFVFVGEAPGWKGCGRTGMPFYNDRSGMLLRDAMFWSGLSEVDCYISNGQKCCPTANRLNSGYMETDCTDHLDRELGLIYKSAHPKLFAVGRKPEQLLQKTGYECEYLRHPAAAIRGGQYQSYWAELYDAVRGARYDDMRL